MARALATKRQLALATWILREPGSGTRPASDHWLLEHLGPLHVAFELGSAEAIKRLAAAGAGLACLSRHAVARELADGTLVALRTRLPKAPRRLSLVTRREKRMGRMASEFVSLCLASASPALR
jgi:DNA-binding transcriptional LysR family regulator